MQSTWKNQYGAKLHHHEIYKIGRIFIKKAKFCLKKSTEFLLAVMYRTSTGLNKIVEQLPKSAKVTQKFFWKNNAGLTGAENDIAIITLPNGKTYAIAIL